MCNQISERQVSFLSGGILGGFGWYFSKIRFNPWNPNEIYILGVDMYRSEDGGQSWLPNIRINDHGLNDQVTPWLAVGEEDTLYAVWADERDGTSKVYFAKSSDGGLSWSDFDFECGEEVHVAVATGALAPLV